MNHSPVNAITRLAAFVAGAAGREEPFPRAAIDASRHALADTVACMLGGSRLPPTVKCLAACQQWGSGKAGVFGHTVALAPPFAALVNGTAAHALDYDDYDIPANSHPSAVLFPAVLAVMSGRVHTGAEILDAHIVGVEIMLRLGEAMNMAHYKRGWHTTLTLGTVAAAGACARAMRLNQRECVHALSVAASMASGLTNQGGYNAKAVHAGLAAKNGVMAATLAAAGLSASDGVLDGPTSLARSMGNYQPGKFAAALAKVGRPLALLEHGLVTKPYPACSYSHRIIDAARELRSESQGMPHAIASVEISLPDYYLDLLVYPHPADGVQAMFSAPYAVVAALLDGDFSLLTLTDERLMRPEVESLLQRCQVVPRIPPNPDLTLDPDDPDVVTVRHVDGSVRRAEVALPLGTPARPLARTALSRKFMDCTAKVLSASQAERLFAAAMGFGVDCQAADLFVGPTEPTGR